MATYLTFLTLAAVLAVAPGPDTVLTLRNTLVGGRGRGLWTAAGITVAGTVQGVLAAAGLGAVIAQAEPVFAAVRWAGVGYLAYLGVQALLAARHVRARLLAESEAAARPEQGPPEQVRRARRRARVTCVRQGFLCNITNPKVLVFNLAVLPQFVGSGGSFWALMAYALTLVGVGLLVLVTVSVVASRIAPMLARVRVRRGIEAGTGAVLLGCAGALALQG